MNRKVHTEACIVNVSPDAGEPLPDNGRPGWLASLMLKRSGIVLSRFALYYRKLAGLPRPWRMRLQRKLALTASGAALLLALMQAPLQAAPDNTITVVDGEVADVNNGQCSLIEAIINARTTNAGQLRADCAAGNLNGADTIVLPTNGVFDLTAAHNSQFGATGLPVITGNMTIEGNGATINRLLSAPEFRILVVDPNRHLTLRNTIISGGRAEGFNDNGGGILNYGTLNAENSVIAFSRAYRGGGIRNSNTGTVTLTNSMVKSNRAYDYGGGIHNSGTVTINRSTVNRNYATYGGGGVYNTSAGQMTITNSTFTGNDAAGLGSGGGIYNNGDMTLSNSTITGNYSYEGGSGILNEESGTLQMSRTIVSGNYIFDTFGNYDDVPDEISNSGTIVTNNFNLIGHNGDAYSDGFALGATDIVPTEGLDDIVGRLTNNGGPTETRALPLGSPAIDRAPNNACTAAPVNGVDQRGEPRNEDGDGSPSANECDIGAFELEEDAPVSSVAFYVSAAQAGTVDGVAFEPADILRFESGHWFMHFDASDVGITKNVSAFAIDFSPILLSFSANQSIHNVGTVTPWDAVFFNPTRTGDHTAGSFSLAFDGSTVGLTTSGEKIDALESMLGGLAISTSGTMSVPKVGGGTLKAQDEDALFFDYSDEAWLPLFDGTGVPGLKAEDVNALSVDRDTGDVYITLTNAFNLSGVTGNAKDIVKLTVNGNSYTPSLFWDGSAAGFPANLDGLEIIQ